MSWSKPFATLIRAAVAHQRGEAVKEITLLTEAIKSSDDADMRLHAAAARRCLGQVTGGEQGQRLIAEADAWMMEQKIKNPEAMTRMLATGF